MIIGNLAMAFTKPSFYSTKSRQKLETREAAVVYLSQRVEMCHRLQCQAQQLKVFFFDCTGFIDRCKLWFKCENHPGGRAFIRS